MNSERLLKLADFLDNLPKEKFFFGTFVREFGKPILEALAAGNHLCGTVACALGWTPAIFPDFVRWRRTSITYKTYGISLIDHPTNSWEAAQELFDIQDDDDIYWLFSPDYYSNEREEYNGLGDRATPKEVAAHIRKFVEENS